MNIWDRIEHFIDDTGKHIENTLDLFIGNKDFQDFIEDGIHIPLDKVEDLVDSWNSDDVVDKIASQLKIKQDYYPVEGDVLGVERLGYIHWGIYAGNSEVIHFYKNPGIEPIIQKTDISDFQRLRFLGMELHPGYPLTHNEVGGSTPISM